MLGSFFGAYDYSATAGGFHEPTRSRRRTWQWSTHAHYLFYNYNPGDNTLAVYAKAIISDLTITFDPSALVKWTASGMSFARGVITSPSESTALGVGFSTFKPVPGRLAATTIGGAATGLVENATYTFKREEFAPIYTLQGVQDPLALFSGPVSLSVKTSIVMADSTVYNDYINISQPTWETNASAGAGTGINGIDIKTQLANLEDVTVTQTGEVIRLP